MRILDLAREARTAWHRDAVPSADSDGEPEKEAVDDDRWAQLTAEERLIAAPPGATASDGVGGSANAARGSSGSFSGLWNPKGFNLSSQNFVPPSRVAALEQKWTSFRDERVRGDVENVFVCGVFTLACKCVK